MIEYKTQEKRRRIQKYKIKENRIELMKAPTKNKWFA